MAGYGAALGRGMLIGASVALAYAAARGTASLARGARRTAGPGDEASSDRLVDWTWAERVAVRVSGVAPALHPSAAEQLQGEYRAFLSEIEGPVARYTGKSLSLGQTTVEVMDRPAWIRSNLRSFRELLLPLEEFYRERADNLPPGAGRAAQRSAQLVLSAQMGLLLGYLARRVLGQYDLSLLGREPLERGRLYFVEPNLRHAEETLGVPRNEFRRWIALHEATHAYEFELHPWVRDHLNALMRGYLRLLTDDLRKTGGEAVTGVLLRLADNLRRGHNLINALQTPRQRELLTRLQALMSLAEGYSNHVMNAVGRDLLPHFDEIHERVEHRQRHRSRVEELFLRITGLSMKMEQYKRGERFVDAVATERGIAFVNRAWEALENLPTEPEIADPSRWVRRMEAAYA